MVFAIRNLTLIFCVTSEMRRSRHNFLRFGCSKALALITICFTDTLRCRLEFSVAWFSRFRSSKIWLKFSFYRRVYFCVVTTRKSFCRTYLHTIKIDLVANCGASCTHSERSSHIPGIGAEISEFVENLEV